MHTKFPSQKIFSAFFCTNRNAQHAPLHMSTVKNLKCILNSNFISLLGRLSRRCITPIIICSVRLINRYITIIIMTTTKSGQCYQYDNETFIDLYSSGNSRIIDWNLNTKHAKKQNKIQKHKHFGSKHDTALFTDRAQSEHCELVVRTTVLRQNLTSFFVPADIVVDKLQTEQKHNLLLQVTADDIPLEKKRWQQQNVIDLLCVNYGGINRTKCNNSKNKSKI